MSHTPITLAEAFPFAPAIPLLQVQHPVTFSTHSRRLTDFNFAQLVTIPGRPIFLHPWHPQQVALPYVLIAALRSLQSPCPNTSTIIFVIYIWSTPDVQELLSQDPRIADNNWKAFCDLIADAYPAGAHFPPRHISGALRFIPELFAQHYLTPADKAELVCRIREALYAAGALVDIPIDVGAPLGDGAIPHSTLAILREGPIALENTFLYSDAAWELSQNAIIQVLHLFDNHGDDDLRDWAANIIATILQVQEYSLTAITAAQELEEHIAELHERLEQHPNLLQPTAENAPETIEDINEHAGGDNQPPTIDLTADD